MRLRSLPACRVLQGIQQGLRLRKAQHQQAAVAFGQHQHAALVGDQREHLGTADLAEMPGVVAGHRGAEALDAEAIVRAGVEIDDARVIGLDPFSYTHLDVYKRQGPAFTENGKFQMYWPIKN